MAEIPSRLYLAGPMSGITEYNYPKFNRVADWLRKRGYKVFNPAENYDGGAFKRRAFYMRLDIPALLESEGIVLMDGWRDSRGANLEAWIAIDTDLPLFECIESNGDFLLERITPPDLAGLPFGEVPIAEPQM